MPEVEILEVRLKVGFAWTAGLAELAVAWTAGQVVLEEACTSAGNAAVLGTAAEANKTDLLSSMVLMPDWLLEQQLFTDRGGTVCQSEG